MARKWHYTTGQKYAQILQDGLLKLAGTRNPQKQKPVVWFSTHDDWDPSANPIVTTSNGTRRKATVDEALVVAGGLVRIGVDDEIAPHDWHAFKSLSGIAPKLAKNMYDEAIRCGSRPSWWFVSFEAVSRDAWKTVETWNGSQWQTDA